MKLTATTSAFSAGGGCFVKNMAEIYYKSGSAFNKIDYADVGAAAASHTHSVDEVVNTSYSHISKNGKDVLPVTRSLVNIRRACRTAFLDTDHVAIEYSSDGVEWSKDTTISDNEKCSLFAMNNSARIPIGPATSPDEVAVNNAVRVTIRCTLCDSIIDLFCAFFNTYGCTCTCDIERFSNSSLLEDNTDDYAVRVASDITISTSEYTEGSCEIKLPPNRFFTSLSAPDDDGQYRFTFKIVEVNPSITACPYISDIRLYGGDYSNGVKPPSMALFDHLYTWDTSQNVTFPAQVTALNFHGSLTGIADKARMFNTTNIGGYTQPVFIDYRGMPAACSYKLCADVPYTAVFTDEKVDCTSVGTNGSYECYPILKFTNTVATASTAVYAPEVSLKLFTVSSSGCGLAQLVLGNSSYNAAHAGQGSILLYGTKAAGMAYYGFTNSEDGTYGGIRYLVGAAKPDTAIGSDTTPVYVDSTGVIQACTNTYAKFADFASQCATCVGIANVAEGFAYPKKINGTTFSGREDITTDLWGTARSITIGSTSKSVDGSEDVSWDLSEIGAAAAEHTHEASDIGEGTFTGTFIGNASTATMAEALSTSAGSSTKPVYFSNGKPVACAYSIYSSVPSSAVFTDYRASTYNAYDSNSVAYYYPTISSMDSATLAQPHPLNYHPNFQFFGYNSKDASTDGFAGLILGNSTAKGTTGNCQGGLMIYGSGTGNTTYYRYSNSNSNDGRYLITGPSADTAIGSAIQPVYVDSTGTVKTCSYTLGTNVPSNAVFTDTDEKVSVIDITNDDNMTSEEGYLVYRNNKATGNPGTLNCFEGAKIWTTHPTSTSTSTGNNAGVATLTLGSKDTTLIDGGIGIYNIPVNGDPVYTLYKSFRHSFASAICSLIGCSPTAWGVGTGSATKPVYLNANGIITACSSTLTQSALGYNASTGPVPLSVGGTGGTTKETARTGLGITSGTEAPSPSGTPGDVYIQYVE